MTRHNNQVAKRRTMWGRGWRSLVPTSVWFSCMNHTPHIPAGKYPQAVPRDEICPPFLAPGEHSPGFAATGRGLTNMSIHHSPSRPWAGSEGCIALIPAPACRENKGQGYNPSPPPCPPHLPISLGTSKKDISAWQEQKMPPGR